MKNIMFFFFQNWLFMVKYLNNLLLMIRFVLIDIHMLNIMEFYAIMQYESTILAGNMVSNMNLSTIIYT